MGAFLWDDPHHDQWSEITRIIVDQMNQWIHSVQGFIGSLDLPWSEWSRISDADPDHPKETHPIIKHVQVNVNSHKKRKKKSWKWSYTAITCKIMIIYNFIIL